MSIFKRKKYPNRSEGGEKMMEDVYAGPEAFMQMTYAGPNMNSKSRKNPDLSTMQVVYGGPEYFKPKPVPDNVEEDLGDDINICECGARYSKKRKFCPECGRAPKCDED